MDEMTGHKMLYFTLQLLVWHILLTEYLIRHATICVGNICTVSFKACCCCCCYCWWWCCRHLVLTKNSINFSEMLLTIIKVHVDRWMCTWRDTKKWKRYNVHYCKCRLWMHQYIVHTVTWLIFSVSHPHCGFQD
jgi:hypothetical protein